MASFQEGDRVRLVDREATAEDIKSGMYQNHFRGLTGVVQKYYDNDDVAVEVDQETLNEGMATRHREMQDRRKAEWMNGLSDAERNRLTEKEREFRWRYTVLVAAKDLIALPA